MKKRLVKMFQQVQTNEKGWYEESKAIREMREAKAQTRAAFASRLAEL